MLTTGSYPERDPVHAPASRDDRFGSPTGHIRREACLADSIGDVSRKLDPRDRTQLAILAAEHGLTELRQARPRRVQGGAHLDVRGVEERLAVPHDPGLAS